MRVIANWGVILTVLCTGPAHAAKPAAKSLSPQQKTMHLLDRVTFGTRPGDVERATKMGIDKYIDEQLHPERIDDTAADAAIAELKTLELSPSDLSTGYRTGMLPVPGVLDPRSDPQASARPRDQETKRAARQFGAGVAADIQFAKTARAVESKRQLLEVMVDFWTNHFNIDIRKGADRVLKAVDDREVIRKFALGRFRDLLGASAHSPAMLVYLDNARSSAALPGRKSGLNENYAREIMELHTLGVDGGYSQKDVQEVARCLTGWSIDQQSGEFRFYPRRHDDGEKTVLGNFIPAGGGVTDGETVLDILARRPSTAHFIAWKLCRRFVSDNPPQSVVDHATTAFRRSDGDIALVVKTILLSPEFNSTAAYRSKTKSPFEFVVSAVRVLDAHVTIPGTRPDGLKGPGPLANQAALLGEPLFQCMPPTGYTEDSSQWVSAGGSIGRMNFAVALAKGALPGIAVPATTPEFVNPLKAMVLRGRGSKATLASLDTAPGGGASAATSIAMLLGSPEFQRR